MKWKERLNKNCLEDAKLRGEHLTENSGEFHFYNSCGYQTCIRNKIVKTLNQCTQKSHRNESRRVVDEPRGQPPLPQGPPPRGRPSFPRGPPPRGRPPGLPPRGRPPQVALQRDPVVNERMCILPDGSVIENKYLQKALEQQEKELQLVCKGNIDGQATLKGFHRGRQLALKI